MPAHLLVVKSGCLHQDLIWLHLLLLDHSVLFCFFNSGECFSDRRYNRFIFSYSIPGCMCKRCSRVEPLLDTEAYFAMIFTYVHQDLQAATVNPDPSLKEFEGATLRYASLKLR